MKRALTTFLIALMVTSAAHAADFTTWGKSMEITFSGYPSVNDDLTNFPALIILTDGSNEVDFTDFESGGGDLRFTAADESTELNYEVETWDDANSNATIWVQVPLLTNNAVIYAYWDKSSETAPTYTTNGSTWSNGCVAVWHMEQVNATDSTKRGHNGTAQGATASVAGKIGNGNSLTPNNDYIVVPASSDLTLSGDYSISLWVYPRSHSDYEGLLGNHSAVGSFILALYNGQPHGLYMYLKDNGGWASAGATVSEGAWHHIGYTRQGTESKFYIDGVNVKTDIDGDAISGSVNALHIGNGGPDWTSYGLDGILDEVRIESAKRSSNWVWATYMNTTSNRQFVAYADAVSPDPNSPQISTWAATNVTTTGACLNGTLSSTGTSATTAFVYWGETDGETNAMQWANTNTFAAPQDIGPLSTNVTTASNRLYFYRFAASNSATTDWDSRSSVFITDEVSLQTTTTNASELWTSGAFTVYRPAAATNGTLIVNYALSGTASNGQDYVLLDGTVDIPAGQSSVEVAVTPKWDQIVEGTETVRVTLASGPYLLGSQTNGFITIADAPLEREWSGTGNWTNPAYWAGGILPSAGEGARISGGTVTLTNSTPQLDYFIIANATLNFANWSTALRADTVTVQSGGNLKHALCDTNALPGITNRVYIVAGDVTIESDAVINVNEKGFPGGPTGGTYGQGPGGAYGASSGTAGGGGHGGVGGSIYGGGVYDSLDSPSQPGSGGGSRGNDPGEIGGGCVRIDATGRVTVHGTIAANGGDEGAYNGGGSGGSVWISCDTFAGTGLLSANGGRGDGYNGGGGGGGRIAVIYNVTSQTAAGLPATIQYSVNGCKGRYRGDVGTLYLVDDQCLPSHWLGGAEIHLGPSVTALTRTYSDMQFANGRVTYPDMPITLTVTGDMVVVGDSSPDGVTLGWNTTLDVGANLSVTNARLVLGTNISVAGSVQLASAASMSLYALSNQAAMATCSGDWLLTNNSSLYVYAGETNASSPKYGALVDISGDMTVGGSCWVYSRVRNNVNTNNTLGAVLFQMDNLNIASNGGFNADSGGYAGARTNYSSWYGLGPGGGNFANNPSGGGGYGGAGANPSGSHGAPYGSATNSNQHGSGGGMGESRGRDYAGGDGGGIVWIQAEGDVRMDGILSANGETTDNGSNDKYNGAGSGGGILVQTEGTFTGATGSILRAKGGNSYTYDGGGGGGGRIAIWQNTPANLRDRIASEAAATNEYLISSAFDEFKGNTLVNGGVGKTYGADGTSLFLTGIVVSKGAIFRFK